MEFHHLSVLLRESVDKLNIKPDGIYVDGTLGGGGHAAEICARLKSEGCLIGIDRDTTALAAAGERLKKFACRIQLCHNNFFRIKAILQDLDIGCIDGAVLDLGVSSPQLDQRERGFSYHLEAPLDMRMDQEAELTAYHVVNQYTEQKLTDIIFRYGEERFARRIAAEIVQARQKRPVETTTQLAELIKRAFPAGQRYKDKHPAKRTFQAIRIEVNGELEGLDQAIRDFVDVLRPGGRLAVITFHSLEDRIVKSVFADLAQSCTCPKEFPVCVCGGEPMVRLVTRKPITAGVEELKENNRAHSAKLRVAEKV